MPKSPAVAGTAVPKVVHDDDVPVSHLDLLRARADRLARAAVESCRQHERCAEIVERDGVDPAELEGWLELTGVADRLLGEATAAYEKASAILSLRQAAESYCHARPEAREPGGQGR
jgi:hypothetical protein